MEFRYPDSDVAIVAAADDLGEIQEEWRGRDYYYLATTNNGIAFSVLFFKLSEQDLKGLAKMRSGMPDVPEVSPIYPFTYFSLNNKMASDEAMKEQWGDSQGDFLYRQAHIAKIGGMPVEQKNMYAYGMLYTDLFVAVHISKMMCTPEDSTEIRTIIESVQKKK